MVFTPLYHPLAAGSQSKAGYKGSLDKRQTAALTTLKNAAKKNKVPLNLISGPGEQPDCVLLRYLRANSFSEDKALAAALDGIRWCNEVGVAALRGVDEPSELPRIEAAAGDRPASISGAPQAPPSPWPPRLHHLTGFDRQGRPVLVMRATDVADALRAAPGPAPGPPSA
ncbi:unnamed protein product, partial [Phaeothamnion confervicola]